MDEKCKICGNETFAEGNLGNGFTSVASVDKWLGSSPLVLTFCKKCGEVSSI